MKRSWSARLAGAIALAACSGCGSTSIVVVRFSGTPGEALVTVDDEYAGTLESLSRHGLRLPAGQHRVTIEEVGYFPHDRLIVATPERRLEIKVKLQKIPD
jgi:hypothetical protein